MKNNISKNIVWVLALFLILPLLGQGCFAPKKSTSTAGPDMGIWKTSDRGLTWVHKLAYVEGATLTPAAAEFNVQFLAVDPQDRLAVYMGTIDNGLVYSYDGGDSWRKSSALEAKNVKAVAIDAKNKCTLYTISGNKIYKTKTCGRDWNVKFFDPRTDVSFTQIAVDWFNPTLIYAGTSNGDIFKSTDEGESWAVIKRANAAVSSLIISPHDSRLIYAGTDGDGIWKSLDAGNTWLQIRKEFGDIGNARRVIKILPDPVNTNLIYLVHRDGIARSPDAGTTWEAMPLITDIGENKVADLAIDPNDPKKMVYTGPTALVFTQDAGATWEVKKLPTTNHGSKVMIDPIDGNIVYLGIISAKQRR
jgi:photosystem II stability/assembly factor-like uncharacterized protein